MGFHRGRCLLKERLNQKRRSQRWLAAKMNRSEQLISDWATNRQAMNTDNMRTVSYWLGCLMEDLYEWFWLDD